MKKHTSLAVILTLLLSVAAIILSAVNSREDKSKTKTLPVITGSVATADEAEMRGMWVSYISLDMSETDRSEKSFRIKFDSIITTAKAQGCNALFVHVRPFGDALYNSEIFPSSHILWGEQGKEESYDALEIMCEQCRKNGLKIHAWINPYRIKTEASAFTLSGDNPYSVNTELGIEYEGGIYYNPAKSDARKLITEGVKEIVKNYSVDGIHFDDYFYPTCDESFDKAEYNKYLKSFKSSTDALPLNEWRKNNVNLLIAQVYKEIKNINENIVFGISPQGNIKNDLEMGADVYSWCSAKGYIDYICPQLYYSIENPALKFETALESWLELERTENIKLYAGLAVYKAGTDADSGTWLESQNILADELKMLRSKNTDGYILYDYEAIISESAEKEMNAFNELL